MSTGKRAPVRRPSYFEMLDQFERELLEDAIERAKGDKKKAAAALGLALHVFELKVQRLGIDRGPCRSHRRRRNGDDSTPREVDTLHRPRRSS